jgi:hypothetical protein
MPEVKIFENHHEVLEAWSIWRQNNTTICPEVICLDHHTDVLFSLDNVIENSWQDLNIVKEVIASIRHDQHFDWAVRSKLISNARIISHVPAAIKGIDKLEILLDNTLPSEFEMLNCQEKFRPIAQTLLEDDFLIRQLREIPKRPYILDIDCDYFPCKEALMPQKINFFNELWKNAQLVTISKETIWVKLLRLKGDNNFDSNYIVEKLAENR